jgi:hypothetical protein
MKNWIKTYPKLYSFVQRSYFQFFKRHIFGITGPIRSLPDFIIIGTVRSGTTSLYYNICQHECVLTAAYDELGFFDSNYHLGLNWYRSLFPTLFSKWAVKQKTQFAITGEDTPFYIWNPLVAKRILKILPNIKLIVLFRNPVDRAYSNYHLAVREGSENLSFEDAIQVELKNLDKINDNIKQDVNKYAIARSYIAKGFYADQLKIWLELFRFEQLIIISTEDLESNPQKTLDNIYDFLKIPKNHVLIPEKQKIASYPKIKDETRKFLIDLYKKSNAELFTMIGQTFDWDK